MTNDPRRPDNDRTLARELDDLQQEWQRMEHGEPPELVDRAVLNAARRDLEPKRGHRPLRWLGAFATATVVVLAFSVVLDQEPRGPEAPEGLKLEQAPLPSAELQAPTREVRRDLDPVSGASREAAREKDAAATPADREKARMHVAPAMPMADEAQAPPAAELQEDALVEEESPPGPEEWVRRLESLLATGDEAAFERELAAFRALYPEYELPAALEETGP